MHDELVVFKTEQIAHPYRVQVKPSKDTNGTHMYNDMYSNITLLYIQ